MELVQSPVPDLRVLLTESFEMWAAAGATGATGATRASCALSGGATALIFLPALRAAKVDWSKISLFWVDERAVDPDNPESNYGIADRMLLTPLGRKGPRAFRMTFDSPSLWESAGNYDNVLARELSGRPLDLAILGVGDDGHVASLFPGHQALLEDNARVVAVDDAPKHPKRRLSLTMRYLLQSRNIWIVAVGARKLPVLQAALSKTQKATPLDQLLLLQGKRVTVFTDQVIRSVSASRQG
jgi:6-phosphogluconolactonase